MRAAVTHWWPMVIIQYLSNGITRVRAKCDTYDVALQPAAVWGFHTPSNAV